MGGRLPIDRVRLEHMIDAARSAQSFSVAGHALTSIAI
jgi:sigma54-dependent transcription regulator